METTIRSICVYCGSRVGVNEAYVKDAEMMGTLIGKHGYKLVYGAGSIGLMGVVARSALAAGAKVTGVIPEHLDAVEIAQPGLNEIYVTTNMHDRKKLMFDRSDAFILLPGGLGSLDELMEIMTWKQLGLHRKPIIIVNTFGYWDILQNLFHHIVAEGFADKQHTEAVIQVPDPQSAINTLENIRSVDTKAATELI